MRDWLQAAQGDASTEVLEDVSPAGKDNVSTPAPSDAPPPGGSDASQAAPRDRTCTWCRAALEVTARRDAIYCSKRCRQAAHRFGRHLVATTRAAAPLRIAIADPPYPGLSRRYYQDHPDYAGEVDHGELLSRLAGYDGWALATSSTSLQFVLGICSEFGLHPRVAAWTRGSRHSRSSHPLQAWEAVIYMPARAVVEATQVDDALVYHQGARLTDPDRVTGAKPSAWCGWVFRLIGARPGDQLDDLYPGSGGVGRAWELLSRRSSEDTSPPGGQDA